jgi:tight adherence protein C
MLVGIFAVAMSTFFPVVWLNGQIKTRQDEIQRELPDALDMLSVCASAGLGFDQSMQKISDYWDTELGREFQRVIQEMEMGVPRSEALKNMRDRLEVSDLSQFIAIIVQAEKIGMSFAQVLQAQSLQLRVARQVRAREIANKLPGKMIIPLVLFIFPAIIAVIIGPTIPLIMELF